jgi:hypothetical protein
MPYEEFDRILCKKIRREEISEEKGGVILDAISPFHPFGSLRRSD